MLNMNNLSQSDIHSVRSKASDAASGFTGLTDIGIMKNGIPA